jgi:DNA-binding MarR family transcriptional regulator
MDRKDGKDRALVKSIVRTAGEIFRRVKPVIPEEWMTSDLTAAQLRVLLVIYTEGPSRMSAVASYMGVAVSTATGIVDNLVKKGLALRCADPEDRRLVICELSPQGRKTISRLWSLSQGQIEKLLYGLSLEQLEMAKEVVGFILAKVNDKHDGASLDASQIKISEG